MKKYNEFELVGIGVSVYLICIIFGIISKHIFGFDVDVLSASATLFAAFIALYLYSDWRAPYNASKILSERNELLLNLSHLRSEYYKFAIYMRSHNKNLYISDKAYNNHSEYLLLESNLLLCLDEFRDKLYTYKNNSFENMKDENYYFQPGIKAYISQLDSMYSVFMEFDPINDFDKAYNNVKEHFDNGYFGNIIISLTINLRDYLVENK